MTELIQIRLRRAEAATYLKERHGVPVATATLAKLACFGGGPKFRKLGARTVLYDVAELDRWAAEKLGHPLASTSEVA